MADLNMDGMALAPGVVEAIIAFAVREVDGVVAVGPAGVGGLKSKFGGKAFTQGIEVQAAENGALRVAVQIEVAYGHVLPVLAQTVREAIADAVKGQVGMDVACVDVSIEGIRFVK